MENINNITVSELPEELRRRGFTPEQSVDVIIRPKSKAELTITEWNVLGGSFEEWKEEPDLYSDDDLIERYEH